jgi:hypothetical protein
MSVENGSWKWIINTNGASQQSNQITSTLSANDLIPFRTYLPFVNHP